MTIEQEKDIELLKKWIKDDKKMIGKEKPISESSINTESNTKSEEESGYAKLDEFAEFSKDIFKN